MATKSKKTSRAESAASEKTADTAALMRQVIDDGLFVMHFQPIVDLRSRKVFANEALCRPDRDYFQSPVDLIKAAVETDQIGELGRLQRSFAVKHCSESALFVNLDPHEFDEPWLVRPDDPIFKHRHPIYLEITENVPLKYFDQCHSVLAELRKKGNFLVIDDFGAGFSNLKYIAELQPDIVKLDRELVRECRVGTSEAELLELITRLCHEMNARVVAEGIEEPEELAAVIAAGVDFGQGYLFAKPAADPPEIIWPVVPLDPSMVPPDHQTADFSPSSRVATGEINVTEVRKSVEASEREKHQQEEIKKLTDLLVQSEVARLSLVRRLKETSDAQPASSEPPATETAGATPFGAASTGAELAPEVTAPAASEPWESAPTRADDDGWTLGKPPELAPGVSFSVSRKERKLPGSLWAIPAVVVALLLAWFFWPQGDDSPALAANAAPQPISEAAVPQGAIVAQESSEQVAETSAGAAPTLAADDAVGALETETDDPEPSVPASAAAAEQTATVTPSVQIEPTPTAATRTDPQAVITRRIGDWASAWSAKRASDYLTFYSVTFQTPGGESFGDWADIRRQRISRPDWIEVDLSSINVRLTASNRAIATFEQSYSSPGYSDRVRKTQVWIFEYGNWHILAESSEPI